MMLFIKGLHILLPKRSSLIYVFSHNYKKVKIDSYHSLSLEKTLTLHNDIKLIKSVLNEDQNHHCYNISIERFSYE